MKYSVTALLVSSAAAAMNSIGSNSDCGYCVAYGWTYCQRNNDFPYATHDDFLVVEPDGTEETYVSSLYKECEDPE